MTTQDAQTERRMVPLRQGLAEVPLSRRGKVWTFTVARQTPPASLTRAPYAIAYVTLDEGPTMMTNLVDCDFDALRIGQPVRVVWTPTDGGPPVPTFTTR